MKKFISTFLLLCIFSMTASAVEFDASVDENIRKDYDVENLPALPKASPTSSKDSPEVKRVYNTTGKAHVIKRGTRIVLVSKSTIADWSQRGAKINFALQQGITASDGTIIPAGTLVKGTVTDAHRPQISGNGGLVELKIDEIYFNGVMSKIETKLASANSKRVFLSNIKGERRYWKNFSKAMTPGRNVFGAMQTCASVMMPIPVVNVFSIIPLAGGAIVYTANAVVAPVISLFTLGGSLSIPAGSVFEIKMTKSCEIRG